MEIEDVNERFRPEIRPYHSNPVEWPENNRRKLWLNLRDR
jgi:hypothetical protein